jgi:hypothetical protein
MERYTRRVGSYKDEFVSVRERWAQFNNEALRDAGLEARVDHRGYKARGINAEAVPKIPRKVYYMERNRGTGTRQKEMDHSHGEAAGFTRGPGAGGSSDAHDDEDEEKRRKGRSRDNDYGLE